MYDPDKIFSELETAAEDRAEAEYQAHLLERQGEILLAKNMLEAKADGVAIGLCKEHARATDEWEVHVPRRGGGNQEALTGRGRNTTTFRYWPRPDGLRKRRRGRWRDDTGVCGMILKQRKGESIYDYQTRLSWHAMIANIGLMVCGFVFLVLLLLPALLP